MTQYGFYFDIGRCIQCRTCEVACASIHNVESGVRWIKILQSWSGEFPDVKTSFFPLVCLHCRQPKCEESCPTGAISKRAEDGVVVVDRDNCTGCKECLSACPFDVPQFGADGTMQKCDYCLELGGEPVCAVYCPTEALVYGVLEDLPKQARGRTVIKLPGSTEPSMIILKKPVADVIKDIPLFSVGGKSDN